jgi:hypothetical protein
MTIGTIIAYTLGQALGYIALFGGAAYAIYTMINND